MKVTRLFFSTMLVAGMAFTMQSCGGESSTKTESSTAKTESPAPKEEKIVVEDNPMALGEKIYMEKCVVCHQANGEGITGAFPPLKNSDYLFADKVRAVAQVLNGSNEVMIVNGNSYSAPMPQQVNTKEEAVAVINYVLNSWGNDGGKVTLEDVKDVVIDPRQ